MIYVDVPLKQWLKKYPELKVLRKKCSKCGQIRFTDKPFVMKDYAGVTAGTCPCGGDGRTASSMVTTNEKKAAEWKALL